MQKYGVVYPNGFCGQWLVWMMQSHPDFSFQGKLRYGQFVNIDNKSRHLRDAPSWTPYVDYSAELTSSLTAKKFLPPISPLMSFDDFKDQHDIVTDKFIFRLGPNHGPDCVSMFLAEYNSRDIKFISLSTSSNKHLDYIHTRIQSYTRSEERILSGVNNNIGRRLYAAESFQRKANKFNIPYILIDIGKLVFDADVDEYKKLCDYTNTEYRVDIFKQFQQEYYNEVWKYIIE